MDGLRKAIAIDFDGCLCTDAFPAIGEPNWPVIKRAQAEQRAGAGLILWTCREGALLLEAYDACMDWGLHFDAVNESLPDWIEAFGTQPRKVGASEYWDDKAVSIPVTDRFFVGGPGDDSIELIEPKPNAELKPCPFCGSAHVIYERYGAPAGERWRCWCAECLAGIDPGTAQEAGQVREMWNRRSDPPNDPLTLEELREMGGEPVWIDDWYEDFRGWELSETASDYFEGESRTVEAYGTRWVAYRHKPEEAVKEADSLINRTLPELTREKLAEEYLNICDHDCGVDRSVGIPACPFYDPPDVDDPGASVPERCKLDAILKGAAGP